MKPKKCGYPRYVLTLLTLMSLHNHGKAAPYDYIIDAANQCHRINSQTDRGVRAMTDLTCIDVFQALDTLSLNINCRGWSDGKCRLVSPGDAVYQCSVKVPNPCGLVPRRPQTIFDCAPALRPADPTERDRPPSGSTASRRAAKGKGKAPAQERVTTKSRRTDSGSGSGRANPFSTGVSTQAPGVSYTGGSPCAGGSPYAGGSPCAGGSAPAGYSLPRTPQHTTHSDPTEAPNFNVHDFFRNNPSLDSIFGTSRPANLPPNPPPGHITDESFGVEAYMNEEDFESSSPPRGPLGAADEGGAEDTPAWTCPEPNCGSTLRNKNSIKVHQWKHATIRLGHTTCRKCGRVLASLENFDRHIKAHFKKDGVWVLTCGVCGEEFKDERDMRHHESRYNHWTIRQLPTCRECGQSFQLEKDLKTHELIHEAFNLAENKCHRCREVFKSEKELKFHMGAKHGPGAASQPDSNRPLFCDSCGKTLSDLKQRVMHKRAHTGETSCHICGAYFGDLKNKTKHLRLKHPDRDDDQNENR